jgi:hypothetical protein
MRSLSVYFFYIHAIFSISNAINNLHAWLNRRANGCSCSFQEQLAFDTIQRRTTVSSPPVNRRRNRYQVIEKIWGINVMILKVFSPKNWKFFPQNYPS